MAQGCLAACPKQRCPPSTKFQGPNVACAYGLQLPIAQGRPAWLWPVVAAVWCSMHTTSRQPCHALIIARPDNVEESELFEISPNPFSNQITGTFYSHSQQSVVIRLVNSLGQEVRRFDSTAENFTAVEFTFSDLQFLTQGMYTLHIESDSGKFYQKMVKLRQ